MPNYQTSFHLNTQELDLIESALRDLMNQHTAGSRSEPATAPQRAREIRDLLGKLHQQKIFFSHAGGAPSPNG